MPAHSQTITVATVNDDWASKGSNYAEVANVDVVLIQEGKRADYAKLVDPKTRGVLQDRTSAATSGSVIIWTLTAVLMQKTGLTFGVKAKGLLTRFLAWLRCTVGGRRVLFISAHRPPKRARHWWHPFDLALAARVRRALLFRRVVIVGMDANEAMPRTLARMCGLTWHSTGADRIDGFLVSKSVTVKSVRALPKDTSDHQPVVAVMEIALLGKPVVHYPPIEAARAQSHSGPPFGEGQCLMRVRLCYGVDARDGDAITAWRNAVHKHPETNPNRIPRGYPVFYAGGDHGHVAISAGDGMCWSTDSNRVGFFDHVPITQPITQWGKTLLGWTEDLNGVNLTISN